MNIVKWIIVGLIGLIAFIILGLLVAIIGGAADSQGVSNFFRILRDFFIIVLALQGILISVALIVLVVQVSALVSIVRTEIKPILTETREAISTLRGTAQFVSKNVTSPIIRTSAAVAGVTAFFREVGNLRHNLRGGADARSRQAIRLGKDDLTKEIEKAEKEIEKQIAKTEKLVEKRNATPPVHGS